MKVAVTILVFCVAALLALGMVMLYSSSLDQAGVRNLGKQLVSCGLGLVLALVMIAVDYRRLKKVAWPLFIGGLILLGLVFMPHIGVHRKGASRWVGWNNGALFQPSEFAKIALLVLLAWYGERYQRQMGTWKRGVLFPGLLVGLVMGLIFKEPDVGNALLVATVSGMVLLIAGVRLWHLLPPVIACGLLVSLFISHNQMRSGRIYSWLHLEETRRDKGMQAYEAMIALGSGGLTGKGLGDSRQKFGFVSEHHTDFIYAIVGEELGLAATAAILAAFAGLVTCGLYIAGHACDTFGLLLGSGVSFLIGLQACINVGVVTSALPNKGLPLPFISYGGSNLLAMLVCVGILLSIARRAREAASLRQGRAESAEEPNPFARRRAATESSPA
jgi:cell division protein FtsW